MESSRFFSFDDSLWPFLRVQLRGMPTNEEYGEYLQASTLYLQRRQRHLVVLDMLQLRLTTTEQIHRQAEWATKHEALLGETMIGSSFALASSFMRVGLNVLFYLRPPTAPYFVAPSLELALSWGTQRLEAVGLRECAAKVRRRYAAPASVHAGERFRL